MSWTETDGTCTNLACGKSSSVEIQSGLCSECLEQQMREEEGLSPCCGERINGLEICGGCGEHVSGDTDLVNQILAKGAGVSLAAVVAFVGVMLWLVQASDLKW